jgi:hypothetical protein
MQMLWELNVFAAQVRQSRFLDPDQFAESK